MERAAIPAGQIRDSRRTYMIFAATSGVDFDTVRLLLGYRVRWTAESWAVGVNHSRLLEAAELVGLASPPPCVGKPRLVLNAKLHRLATENEGSSLGAGRREYL